VDRRSARAAARLRASALDRDQRRRCGSRRAGGARPCRPRRRRRVGGGDGGGYGLARRARAYGASSGAAERGGEGGATSGPARARVRSAAGRWLLLQGSPLASGSGRVAVVVEPARSVEVAPLLASAYGLTAREREVLREVLQGRSTKQIAASLSVAPYTVQDHLKSIFAKTGSGSRSELVARLFFEHFEPRLGDPLGSDGRPRP
jgi:DNA-binding CsgD family transcriptional regulator